MKVWLLGCVIVAGYTVGCTDATTGSETTGPGGAGGDGGMGGSPAGSGGVGGSGGSSGGEGGEGGEGGAVPAPTCPAYGAPENRGLVIGDGLYELSGLAASRAHPGVLWAHNDSGDAPRIFALRAADAAHLGTYAVSGADFDDWEDIAIGPYQGGDALFIGDIGDNAHERDSVRVWILPEPAVAVDQAFVSTSAAGAVGMTLHYPAGAENAEALIADPANGDVYILTKTNSGVSDVYLKAAPHTAGEETTLTLVATLPPRPGSPQVTAADASPDGTRVLVRSYDSAFVYLRGQGMTFAEAFAAGHCIVANADEVQGEAVAFAADGLGYFSVSENEGGDPNAPQPLWFFAE